METPVIYIPCTRCNGTGMETTGTRCIGCMGKKRMLSEFGESIKELINEVVDSRSFAHTWDLPE